MEKQQVLDAMLKALLDVIPPAWLAAQMHVLRVRKADGRETLRVTITNPKGKTGDLNPSERLLDLINQFSPFGPEGWTSFDMKVKRKREGGWRLDHQFKVDEAEAAAAAADSDENGRQADFGLRFLGTWTRVAVRREKKAGWVLTERRWLCFLPLGTKRTKLGRCDRIWTYVQLRSNRWIVELEATGQSSLRVYDGRNQARKEWLVQTLRDLLGAPVEQTSLLSARGGD
jgi:hypothetical protein